MKSILRGWTYRNKEDRALSQISNQIPHEKVRSLTFLNYEKNWQTELPQITDLQQCHPFFGLVFSKKMILSSSNKARMEQPFGDLE